MRSSRVPSWRRVASLIAVTGLALGVAATSAAADEEEPATGSIFGKVTLPAGADPEWYRGVSVLVETEDDSEGTYTRGTSPIDAEGNYRIDGLRADDYTVLFQVTSYNESWDRFDPNLRTAYYPGARLKDDADWIEVKDDQPTEINFTLSLGHVISGTVKVPEDTRPGWHQGVSVYVGNLDDPYGSDPVEVSEQGTYAFPGLYDGHYIVSFAVGDFYDEAANKRVSTGLLPSYYPAGQSRSEAVPVEVDGASKSSIDVTMDPAFSISGSLTVAEGADESWLKHVRVEVYRADAEWDEDVGGYDPVAHANVDPADHTYTVGGLEPGTYIVGFTPVSAVPDLGQGYSSNPLLAQYYSDALSFETATPITVETDRTGINGVLTTAGTISGNVSVPEGVDDAGLQGVDVWAYHRDLDIVGYARVNSNTGDYQIRSLAPGDYVVEFRMDENWAAELQEVLGISLASQFYDGVTERDQATPVPVADTGVSGIDAVLQGKDEVDPAPEVYSVTFNSAGGSEVEAASVEEGKTVDKPKAPTRAGYTFEGWLLGDEDYDFTAQVTGNITLTASWQAEVTPDPDPTETPEPEPTKSPAKPGPKPVAKPANLVDVSSNPNSGNYSQFHSQIQWLAEMGITRGWDVGGGKHEFRAKEEITREAMAAFMYRYAGSPDVKLPATSPFTDVTPSNTNFYKQIIWLNQEGISTGWNMPNGTKEFRPKNNITRDAMAAFMYRYAGKPATTPPAKSPFTDVSKSTQFYKEIAWLNNTGISRGWTMGGGKYEYRPYAQISREAMAAFLFRHNAL